MTGPDGRARLAPMLSDETDAILEPDWGASGSVQGSVAAHRPGVEPAGGRGFQAVEVRNRYDGRWTGGYDIVEVDIVGAEARYQLRRRGDGTLLPGWFSQEEIRYPNAAFSVVWQLRD